MTIYLTKLATEDEDWVFDWTPKGVSGDDPISTFTVGTPAPDDLTVHSATHTQTSTTVWFSGGTSGVVYVVLLTVVTAGGRTYAENIQLTITS